MFSKNNFAIFLMTIALSVFAQDANKNTKNNRKFYEQGYEVNKYNMMQAYNAPAKTNQNFDFFIEGALIWWQPKEKGLTIGKDYSDSVNFQTNPLNLFNFKANYMAGFKAGIGFHHHFDNWTFCFLYTWFDRHSTYSIKKNTLVHSEWLAAAAHEIYTKWKLDFNLLDFEISRKNLTGKKVSFLPHFNICSGRLNQAFAVMGPNSNSYASSNSWLLGPKAGIKTFWNIKLVKLLANVSASIFYQNYSRVNYDLFDKTTSSYSHRIRMKEKYIAPNLNLSSGFCFEKHFENRGEVTLRAMYEILHFWNQNQMRYLLNQTNYTRFDAGSLMLHGITGSLRWDF